MQNKWARLLLDVFVMLLPIGITGFVAVKYLTQLTEPSDWYFGAILGIVLALWVAMWGVRNNLATCVNALQKNNTFSIEVVPREQIPNRIASLYSIRNRKIQATHIGYSKTVHKHDARHKDFAEKLYIGDRHIPFERIVHIENEDDLNWVRHMVQESTNENYHIHVLKGEVAAPYPNFLIAEDNNHRKTLFMSFRGAWGGDRTFAFLTDNIDLIEGLESHFAATFNELQPAQQYIAEFDAKPTPNKGD